MNTNRRTGVGKEPALFITKAARSVQHMRLMIAGQVVLVNQVNGNNVTVIYETVGGVWPDASESPNHANDSWRKSNRSKHFAEKHGQGPAQKPSGLLGSLIKKVDK